MKVAVVYSPAPREVDLSELDVADAATVADALRASGLFARHTGLMAAGLRVGIWGRACNLQSPLREGDRIEVYRALKVDPKEARRRRVAAQGRRQPARR